jgi:hypothetical protein
VSPAPLTPVLVTERLALRRLTTGDAEFILELLNEPSFLQHIGDKGVHLLAKLGFRFERTFRLADAAPEIRVFSRDA